jgi:hypothetical protein
VTHEEIPPGGREAGDPVWDPWLPDDIARLLSGANVPWCVAGGWALDLFRGQQTREHGDLEIAVPAVSFGAIRAALAGFDFEVAGSGRLWPLDSPAFEVMHQTWVSEPDSGVYRLDIFREPQSDGSWVCAATRPSGSRTSRSSDARATAFRTWSRRSSSCSRPSTRPSPRTRWTSRARGRCSIPVPSPGWDGPWRGYTPVTPGSVRCEASG